MFSMSLMHSCQRLRQLIEARGVKRSLVNVMKLCTTLSELSCTLTTRIVISVPSVRSETVHSRRNKTIGLRQTATRWDRCPGSCLNQRYGALL
jgi:hypothetical protein